jgi:hypothetical protein
MAGLTLWLIATLVLGGEPWDFREYTQYYLVALCLSAFFGHRYRFRPWRWGLILVFAQIPLIAMSPNGQGLLPAGLLYTLLLSLPAMAVASAASYLTKLYRRG